MKIVLRIAYLGTAYHGFQVQPNGILTIQKILQDAVENVYGARFPLTGCSRTDSGVHAEEFFCTVEAGGECLRIPCARIPDALNRYLPQDIAVTGAGMAQDSFHPRYAAHEKEYRYLISNGGLRDPFLSGRAMFYPKPLDAELMNRAAQCFLGTHDFAGFMAQGSSVTDTVRTVTESHVEKTDGVVYFTVRANGFLYNMVRIMAGTLIEVSEGKIQLAELPSVLASCKREKAGFTAPPEGLYLHRVLYPDGLFTIQTKRGED